ncbi:MAG: potassium channel protein [Planctomycetota bacterium]
MRQNEIGILERIARLTAPAMFAVAFLFLVCQAVLVVIWVDVPNLSETATLALREGSPDEDSIRKIIEQQMIDERVQFAALSLMAAIWPVVILESVVHWFTRPWNRQARWLHFYGLLFCICPSLRMCARSYEVNQRMWLPMLGWRVNNNRLRRRLERIFSWPMLIIALMIMPVLLAEYFMKDQIARYRPLRLSLHIGTGVIWFAFAGEFILMVSVAKKRVQYCREHWVDLVIILLPLISFLRTLRVLRATQLTQLFKLQSVNKIARLYRLRGTAVKLLRAMIVFDVLQRVQRNANEKKIERLQRKLADAEAVTKSLRREIAKLQRDQDSVTQTDSGQ